MHVLVADPDSEDLASTRTALADAGLEVTTAGSVSTATDAVEAASVDAVVTEYELPDGTGLDLVERTRSTVPDALCVVYTDVAFEEMATAAYDGVVAEYLSKDNPSPRDELRSLLEHGTAMQTQTAYPLPDDENARQVALERFAVDPDALGASFDRLTELGAALFDVDSAAVGLIDAHHERFLACHGADFDTAEREATVCTYTILDDGVTVVEDVRADPRFEDDDWITTAGVTFYAGAPLVTDDGHAIGVFCLHDDKPRSLSDRERHLLEQLADEAMAQLELRRRLRGDDD